MNNSKYLAIGLIVSTILFFGVLLSSAPLDAQSCTDFETQRVKSKQSVESSSEEINCNIESLKSIKMSSPTASVTTTPANGFATLNVTPAAETDSTADLAITISDSHDPIAPGEQLTYEIMLSNHGPSTAGGITLFMKLSEDTIFVETTPDEVSCNETENDLTCVLEDSLANQDSITINLVVIPIVEGRLENIINVSSATVDLDESNNRAVEETTVIGDTLTPSPTPSLTPTSTPTPTPLPADLAVSMSDSPDSVIVGEELTYVISATNHGPGSAADVILFDDLPENVLFTSVTASQGYCPSAVEGDLTCQLGTIENQQSLMITMTLIPTMTGRIRNVVNLSSDMTIDLDLENNTVAEETIINQELLSITNITPNYGLNDVPTEIYINGSGFAEPLNVMLELLTTTLGITETLNIIPLELSRIDPVLIRAIVPAESLAGTYDVKVETKVGRVSLPKAYQVEDAAVIDDLLSFREWLSPKPVQIRVGETDSTLALSVQLLGKRSPVSNATVEFRLNTAEGEVLGRTTINKTLEPFDTQATMPLLWEPKEAGDYQIVAIIDPDNEVEETNEENNIVTRIIPVLPAAEDVSAPVVDSFVIADDAQTTENKEITLDVRASDSEDIGIASGIQAIKFIEFEYILGVHRWVPVERSPWIDYSLAQSNYPWTLIETYGMRYIQAWTADKAGHISLEPGVDVIDLLPLEQVGQVAQRGVVFYRIYAELGETLSVTLTPESGDPDLYVWGPNGEWWYSNDYTGEEQVSFVAPVKGTYQIEIHGYSSAEYRLNFDTTMVVPAGSRSKPRPEEPSVSLDEWPEYYEVAPPDVTPYKLYLPVIIR